MYWKMSENGIFDENTYENRPKYAFKGWKSILVDTMDIPRLEEKKINFWDYPPGEHRGEFRAKFV